MPEEMNSSVVCPESTIESAQRRSFIKRAALVTAAAGVSSTVIGKSIVPQSDAASSACVTVTTPTCPNPTGSLAVWDGGKSITANIPAKLKAASSCVSGVAALTVCNPCGAGLCVTARSYAITGKVNSSIGTGVHGRNDGPPCPCCIGPIGVCGFAKCGIGVTGQSCSGYASLYALAGLFEPSPSSKTIGVAAVSAKGIGVCAESYTCIGLQAASQKNQVVGKFKNTRPSCCSGDRSALIQVENSDTTVVDWNLGVSGKCNASKIPDGSFYLQRAGLSNIPIAINKCGYVGINNSNPYRRLCITGRFQASCGFGVGTQTIQTSMSLNGSMAAKAKIVKASYPMTTTDFVILAAGTSAITITLPPANTGGSYGTCVAGGMFVFIKNTNGNPVTVKPHGTDTLETYTASGLALNKQYDGVVLVSNGSNAWFIFSGAKCGSFIV